MMKKVLMIPGKNSRIARLNVADESRSRHLSACPACMLFNGPQDRAYPEMMKNRATIDGPETNSRINGNCMMYRLFGEDP